jgi:hypothetical protein
VSWNLFAGGDDANVICMCAGVLALKAAVVGGPVNTTDGLNATWTAVNTSTPCHQVDPNCQRCPAPGVCGTVVPNATAPVRYYCNAFGITCENGRVASITFGGLVVSQLPPPINQLAWLRELGECEVSLLLVRPGYMSSFLTWRDGWCDLPKVQVVHSGL